MENKEYLYSNMQIIILTVLFMGSMDFLSLHYYCVFLAFILCTVLKLGKISLDNSALLLLGFAFCYIIFVPVSTFSITSIMKPFSYPISYCIGLNVFSESKSNFSTLQTKTYKAIIIVSIGAFTHYVLNYIINFGSLQRNTVDIWSGTFRSATGQASLAIMAIAVFIATLFSKTSIKAKIISVIGLLITLGYNLILAGRTLIAMTVVLFLVAYVFSQITMSMVNKVKMTLIIIVTIVVLLFLYNIEALNIKSIISQSNFLRRFEIETFNESVRSLYKLKYLKFIFVYPFGGGKIHDAVGAYAHDLYLDAYSDVGVLGFAFLIAFMIISLIRILRAIKSKMLTNDMKIMLLLICLAILFEFMIEPILAGVQWMFCSFCFIQGMLDNLLISCSMNKLRSLY